MNKKIKQVLVIALALALLLGFGSFVSDPCEVMAAERFQPFSDIKVDLQIDEVNQVSDDMLRSQRFVDSFSDSNIKLFGIKQNGFIHVYAASLASTSFTYRNVQWYKGEMTSSESKNVSLSNKTSYESSCYFYNDFWAIPSSSDVFIMRCFVPYVVVPDDQVVNIGYWCDAVFNGVWDGFTCDFTADATYDDAVDNLGYLQNVAFKSVRVASTTEPPIIYLPIDRFTFSNTTTKDVLLSDADYDIEYFIIHRSYASKSDYDKKNIYKKSWSDLYYLSKQEHVFNDSTVNSIDNGVLWYYFDSDSTSWVSEISEGLNRTYAVYSSVVFMRPVKRDGNTLKAGGWTKIDFDLNNSPHVTNGHNPFDNDNPQGMPDDDGNFGDVESERDIDYDIGYGDNVDDASNDKSNIDDIIDFVNDFDLSSLSDILVQLGEAARSFANLLGVVFGWMPTWVRGSLIAAVCIWIFMLIKRAIF